MRHGVLAPISHGLLCLLFCLAAGLPVAESAHPAPAGVGPLDSVAIDRYVESEMRAARIPGAAIGIVKDGQILYVKGYGVADPTGRAVTPQTPFFLGSVSKSFTALAIMQLVEAGKIDLDAPVQRYLPEFRLADPLASQVITVRQLLEQTSGLSTYAGEVAFVGQLDSLATLLRGQSALKAAGPPGAQFQYSNLNYMILGDVIEAVAGIPYAQYVTQRIFAPLGMTHGYASPEQARAEGLATGYQYFFGLARATASPNNPASVPAGRLIASAEDMARYLAMWLNEGQSGDATLVTPTGRAQLQAPAVPVTSYTRYGMGWYTNPDGSVVWHGGSTENFRASMKILTQERLAVIALYNITDDTLQALFGGGFLIQDGIISILYGETPPISSIVNAGQIYFVLDALALLVVFGVVLDLVGLRRWPARLRLGRRRRILGLALTLVVNFLLPLAVLLALPRVVAWPVVLANIPDFGYLTIGLALALLGSGLAKVVMLMRALAAQAPSPALVSP
jgi:CubicO group peptidase (beta-lactamase class C family)